AGGGDGHGGGKSGGGSSSHTEKKRTFPLPAIVHWRSSDRKRKLSASLRHSNRKVGIASGEDDLAAQVAHDKARARHNWRVMKTALMAV
ncbi:unnamed protein product, partial [Phaeothamnion confervicola]